MRKSDIKKIKTYNQFEKFCREHNLSIVCDISYRGGTLGVYSGGLAEELNISESLLPRKVGAYCNYLGGGLRGSICCTNGFASHGVPKRKAELLDEFSEMCKRVYESVENEEHMNDEELPNGETNWEAKGTNASRLAGVVSGF